MRADRTVWTLASANATVLAGIIAVTYLPQHPEKTLRQLESAAPPIAATASLADVPSVSLAGLREHPAFYRSRSVVVEEDTAAILASKPNLVLAGALLLPKGKAVAYLRAPGADAPLIRVHEGERVADWTVRHIETHRVVIGHNEITAEIVSPEEPRSNGLVRTQMVVARAIPPGPRVLGATGASRASPSPATIQREPRLYRPPPPRSSDGHS